MFLIQVLSIVLSLSDASTLLASSQWVRVSEGERRCTSTCGRIGMDDVTAKSESVIGSSICAGTDKSDSPKRPGLQRLAAPSHCQITAGQDVEAANCLCAEDGVAGGKDLQWLPAIAKGRCDTTCQKEGPKGYGYAVYASYDKDGGWRHVCAASDGSIGFTGAGKFGCTSFSGTHENFDCLCTRSFSGDLEPGLNP